jgi:hypothetical protein
MKVIAVSLFLAFAAPWAAVGFAAAPGHVMACCPSDQSDPMVRPCCAMDADRNGLAVPPTTVAVAPLQPAGVFVPPVDPQRFPSDALSARSTRPIEIRLLTSVILI